MNDDDLQALRELPVRRGPAITAARRAFVQAAEGRRLPFSLPVLVVPVALASVIGIYLAWAVGTASALLQ